MARLARRTSSHQCLPDARENRRKDLGNCSLGRHRCTSHLGGPTSRWIHPPTSPRPPRQPAIRLDACTRVSPSQLDISAELPMFYIRCLCQGPERQWGGGSPRPRLQTSRTTRCMNRGKNPRARESQQGEKKRLHSLAKGYRGAATRSEYLSMLPYLRLLANVLPSSPPPTSDLPPTRPFTSPCS